jgi:YD repeat-containing protein
MTKTTIIAALALVALTAAASAQQRTFYDARGNVVGRSSTDSSGTTTNYDARGKVISRETTTGNRTTHGDWLLTTRFLDDREALKLAR